jgi:hypothetical protein
MLNMCFRSMANEQKAGLTGFFWFCSWFWLVFKAAHACKDHGGVVFVAGGYSVGIAE